MYLSKVETGHSTQIIFLHENDPIKNRKSSSIIHIGEYELVDEIAVLVKEGCDIPLNKWNDFLFGAILVDRFLKEKRFLNK